MNLFQYSWFPQCACRTIIIIDLSVTASTMCRENSDSEGEDEEQEIPAWAQDANLRREIIGQQRLDPDELFQQHEKTCPLDEVFASLKTGESASAAGMSNYVSLHLLFHSLCMAFGIWMFSGRTPLWSILF